MDTQEHIEEVKILESRRKVGYKDEYINDLTKFMDTMMEINTHPDFCTTYILLWGDNNENKTIRFPGASRGGIVTDSEGVITDIILHEDMCFDKEKLADMRYKRELVEEIKKFIGYKIIFLHEEEEYVNPTGDKW